MPTTTKKATTTTTDGAALLAADLHAETLKTIAAAELLDQLVDSHDNCDLQSPAELKLTGAERRIALEYFPALTGRRIENNFDLLAVLRHHTATRNLLDQNLTAEKLAAAEAVEREAAEELAQARRAFEQATDRREKLEAEITLEEVEVRHNEALCRKMAIKGTRMELFRRAPQPLKAMAAERKQAIDQQFKVDLAELRAEIRGLEHLVGDLGRGWLSVGANPVFEVVAEYAPEAVSRDSGGRSLKRAAWQAALDRIEDEQLPAMLARYEEQLAEYEALIAATNEPIDRWIEAKKLTADMLVAQD